MSDELKVWYDAKRDCLSTNAAFVLARRLGVEPMTAARMLLEDLKDNEELRRLTGSV